MDYRFTLKGLLNTYLRVGVDSTPKNFMRTFLQIRFDRKCCESITTCYVINLNIKKQKQKKPDG